MVERRSPDPGGNAALRRSFRITLIYAALGVAWIFGSDHIALLSAGEAGDLAVLQRIKGLVYVALTAGLLFMLIHGALRSLAASERETRATLRRLEEALAEREVLLREIHHRVKNNLQIVSSLLMLERHAGATGNGAQAGLNRALARIRTISRIHEQFYHGTDLTSVDLARYLDGLTSEILSSYQTGRRIRTQTRFEAVRLDFDRTIPVGLILHELLAIACSREFPADVEPTVTVELDRSAERITLSVADNGLDASPGAARADESPPLASMLVRALADQVDATVTVLDDGGVSVSVPAC